MKGPFDAALDLLSQCRVVFIKKSAGSLNLLTEARLINRFRPASPELSRVYGGYYLAELINSLTEDFDPAPSIYDLCVNTLEALANSDINSSLIIVQFEIALLREVGVLPNLYECSVCGDPVPLASSEASFEENRRFAHWVSQGGLLCGSCRREEFAGTSISTASVQLLRQLSHPETILTDISMATSGHLAECHRFAVSCICQATGRKPSTLRYIQIY